MISRPSPRTPVKVLCSGCFVVIEGLDGSGGTTQLQRLAAAWREREPEREIVTTREPSDGPVGRLIRAQLAGEELGDAVLPYLFAADRRDHLDRVVLPVMARGGVVLSDRYALSSFAYQSAALGLPEVQRLNAAFPAPTLTLLLDLAPEACLDRIARRGAPRDRFETLTRLESVQRAYEAAIAATPAWPLVRIDAAPDADEVHARILEVIWPT